MNLRITLLVSLCFMLLVAPAQAQHGNLEQALHSEPVERLATDAAQHGNATRGAILFHQLQMSCTKCHSVDGSANNLGPELTVWKTKPNNAYLVQAVLEPSHAIREGYSLLSVQTADGKALSGLLVEQTPEQLVLRDLSSGKTMAIASDQIEAQVDTKKSPMPAGLANGLATRQEFLDLVRYLQELRDGGLPRARELQPSPALYALQLPEYEAHVDHAGLLKGLDTAALKRGREIYERLCINCHGTVDRPGSLPTSLRFASGKFKNGSDPYTMYQTLTRGFGLMAPQTWMVPQQKYDVIHYIRETYLKPHNPSQLFALNEQYLAALPQGDTFGPEPRKYEPWVTMNYGPTMINTFEVGNNGTNFAYKGIATRLDSGPGGISRGKAWMIFDHDTLRMAAAWTGNGFIDWNGIHFNGKHGTHPRVAGEVQAANPTGPGWANPATDSFDDDQRVLGRNDRRYGPLPREWAKYRGLYRSGEQFVVSYTVGTTNILEQAAAWKVARSQPPAQEKKPNKKPEESSATIFTRTLNLGPRNQELIMLVATSNQAQPQLRELKQAAIFGDELLAGLHGATAGCTWEVREQKLCLRIPAGKEPLELRVWFTELAEGEGQPEQLIAAIPHQEPLTNLQTLTTGGAPLWPETLTTVAVLGNDTQPLAVDVLTHPEENPWLAQMRFSGLDFYPSGEQAVVCSWDGDVWLVAGLNKLSASEPAARQLTWQRIASGLFQPLGIKIVDNQIFVTCRDQLVHLHDLNGDQEIDYYECFNNDHQVTDHFHEFAMGLQVDRNGNFLYAKSARHALPALVPHHGTLLRVSADGTRTEIVANGFRAANGVCLNPDGTFVVTDQEGHWNPKNRINWVTEGGFYGNMFGYHDVTDSSDEAMIPPLCWITNAFDRSPAELLWVPEDCWGPLGGSLLNLSYGYGKMFIVPFEEVAGQKQGGMCMLPIGQLPTGVMRGRFHPTDHQLYACGLVAWATSQRQPGGLYRIRHTGLPAYLPVGLHAKKERMEITFSAPIEVAAATDVANYRIKAWDLKRTANYGSKHYNERELKVTKAAIDDSHQTVTLTIPELAPTWGMEITCYLKTPTGEPVQRVIHNSIYHLAD